MRATIGFVFVTMCIMVFSPFAGAAADEAQPCVQVGVVAQRYPWNGTIDVGYKASGLPAAGTNATVTVTANGRRYAQGVTISNGTNTVAFTELPKEFKAKDAKVTLTLGAE